MATIDITNVTSLEVHLGSFYKTLAASETISLTGRDPGELSGMPDVQKELAAGNITVTITPTADELASGLLAPQQSVEAQDAAPVAATDVAALEQTFFVDVVATGAGADDVTVYAAGALPYKFRILEAIFYIETSPGASTATLRDEAAGAGNALGAFDQSATGKIDSDDVTTPVVTPGASIGLFLRRSNGNSVGKLVVRVRRES